MEHEFAEKTAVVDRYLLNEVSAEERVAFEAHFFDCPICSDKVRKGAIFIDAAKEIMCAEAPNMVPNVDTARTPSWFVWLRQGLNQVLRLPALAPSFAALALATVVGYQNLVTLPALRQPQVLSMAVIAPLAREKAPVITVDPRLPHFNVNFMVDSPRVYPSYVCQFRNESGREVLTLDSGPQDVSSFTLGFLLQLSQFPDGRYELTLRPRLDPTVVVQRYTFVVRRDVPK